MFNWKTSNSAIVAPRFTEYIIPAGKHYSRNNSFKQLSNPELRFLVIFDSSAIYENEKPENQYDINKLYGFSDCGSQHHKNSARFGWRWNRNVIEIHAYWYNDSLRFHKLLDTVAIGQPHELALAVQPGHYIFEISNQKYFVPRHCTGSIIEGYLLYPYFGGDETAPHDIRIKIRDL